MIRSRTPAECDDDGSHRRHVWRQRRGKELDSRLHQKASSPSDESGEEEDVSTFLDSFSTFGMSARKLAPALQTADTPQSAFPTSPCQEATAGRQTRETKYVVDHHTRATMEMSKPLAQAS